jgi:DNA-directed RNA polymerase specialized sigma24 family protein
MVTQQLSDEEVYRKYADDLVRFAMGLVGSCDADDVVSGAILRAFSSPS